jgi:hypothetical protein
MVALLEDKSGSPVLVRIRVSHRLAARIRRSQIDRELANGGSPDRSIVLGLRARALESVSMRRRLARQLRRILDDAWSGSARSCLPVPVCRERVRGSSRDVACLAARLLSSDPVSPQGVAQTVLILTDAHGCLYSRRSADNLGARVRTAIVALDPPVA